MPHCLHLALRWADLTCVATLRLSRLAQTARDVSRAGYSEPEPARQRNSGSLEEGLAWGQSNLLAGTERGKEAQDMKTGFEYWKIYQGEKD